MWYEKPENWISDQPRLLSSFLRNLGCIIIISFTAKKDKRNNFLKVTSERRENKKIFYRGLIEEEGSRQRATL